MTLNPSWTAHNATYNEGGEGYNPHAKYIPGSFVGTGPAVAARRMVAGKLRTQADALTFAKTCLNGNQRVAFLAQVSAAFGS